MNDAICCGECKFDCPRKELTEYLLDIGDITDAEMNDLLVWVESGNSAYDNPWYYSDERGRPLDYITTVRVVDDQLAEMESLDGCLENERHCDEETEVPF
jgi:hypothetical protein